MQDNVIGILPFCHWICKWKSATTCSAILKAIPCNVSDILDDCVSHTVFSNTIVQLHRLQIDTPLLLSWMEIYLLKYSGGQTSNTYPTRMQVYLHTFCLHRVRCSPFLQQLLCLTHQWEKTMGGDIKTTPTPSFDLTKGMDVLLLYLQLSRTTKDDYHIVQIAKEDIFYDSNDSDKSSEESEHNENHLSESTKIHKVVSTDGSVYEGELQNGQKHGQGTVTYKYDTREEEVEESYVGQWANDKMDGHGKYLIETYDHCEKYEGEWKCNMKHGYGKFEEDAYDMTYEGQWMCDKQHGHGIGIGYHVDCDNVTKYEGQWMFGEKHGKGKLFLSTDDTRAFEGIWNKDKLSVRGTYTDTNGNVYKGEWGGNGNHPSDWFQFEHGKYTDWFRIEHGKYITGTVYEGEWKDGKRNGQGKCTWASGSVYKGEWKDGKFNGQGKKTWADGTVYEGEWKDDQSNGQGKYTWADGTVYEGEWKDDKMVKGRKTFPTGTVIEGEWKNGTLWGS